MKYYLVGKVIVLSVLLCSTVFAKLDEDALKSIVASTGAKNRLEEAKSINNNADWDSLGGFFTAVKKMILLGNLSDIPRAPLQYWLDNWFKNHNQNKILNSLPAVYDLNSAGYLVLLFNSLDEELASLVINKLKIDKKKEQYIKYLLENTDPYHRDILNKTVPNTGGSDNTLDTLKNTLESLKLKLSELSEQLATL